VRFDELEAELIRLKGMEEQFGELRSRLSRSEAVIEAGKKRLLDLADTIDAYSSEAQELESLECIPDLLASARRKVAEFEKASFIWKSLSDAMASAERLASSLRECEERERNLLEKLDEGRVLSEKRLELEAKERSLAKECDMLALRAEALKKEIAALSADWERIRISGKQGACPLCHQTLGDSYPMIEQEYSERISRANEELASVSRTLAAYRDEKKCSRKRTRCIGTSARRDRSHRERTPGGESDGEDPLQQVRRDCEGTHRSRRSTRSPRDESL